jgi:two-component system response regulator
VCPADPPNPDRLTKTIFKATCELTPKTILLVEDNLSDIELTKRAFIKSRIGNELIVAEDGQQALDFLFGGGISRAGGPSDIPALILLDLNLPKVPGLEVLRRIRAEPRTRRMPVVMLISVEEHPHVAEGYELGANSVIRKPLDFTQFAEVVRQLELYWLISNEPAYFPGKVK